MKMENKKTTDIQELVKELHSAQHSIGWVSSRLQELVKEYAVSDNVEESDEYRVSKSRYTLLKDTLDHLEELYNELEHSIDKVVDSQTNDTEYLLSMLEEYENYGEFSYI